MTGIRVNTDSRRSVRVTLSLISFVQKRISANNDYINHLTMHYYFLCFNVELIKKTRGNGNGGREKEKEREKN